MEAQLTKVQTILLSKMIVKACIAWGEPSDLIEPYLADILVKAQSYDHLIACFERLIEQAPKQAKFAKDWTASPGKLHLPLGGHENCYHQRSGDESEKDRRKPDGNSGRAKK